MIVGLIPQQVYPTPVIRARFVYLVLSAAVPYQTFIDIILALRGYNS